MFSKHVDMIDRGFETHLGYAMGMLPSSDTLVRIYVVGGRQVEYIIPPLSVRQCCLEYSNIGHWYCHLSFLLLLYMGFVRELVPPYISCEYVCEPRFLRRFLLSTLQPILQHRIYIYSFNLLG